MKCQVLKKVNGKLRRCHRKSRKVARAMSLQAFQLGPVQACPHCVDKHRAVR